MTKMRSWFDLLKRFFISDKQSTDEKKDNRKECVFFRRFKVKCKVPPITAPSVSSPERGGGRLIQSEEKQSKHALDVAQAASEPAHVATDVVWHTGAPHFTNQCRKKREEHSAVSIQADDPHCTHHSKKETQEFAAIRIQTAFRGYLARKAFRALRGIVKLQAIIRGRNVRRQAIHTLKCLQSIVNIQSQVCAKRTQKVEGVCGCDANKQLQTLGDKIWKMDTNSPKRWDGSILTKKEAEALFLSKKEAAIKRERIKEYSFSHRNSAETDRCKLNGRWRYWLEQWVDTQLSKSKELEDLDSIVTLNPKPKVVYRRKQYRHRGAQRHYQNEGLYSPAGRTLHRKQCSLGDDKSFSGSPLFPTYMAATESARAKARSLSSPRLRPGASDAHSESYSPCKFKPSLVSSTPTELPTSGRLGRGSWYQQRSPSLKGLQGLMRSTQTMKDLSFDSECSLRTWDHQSCFR